MTNRPIPTALIVDWGGVLTNDLQSVMSTWSLDEGFQPADFAAVMTQWLGAGATVNPIHTLERGESSVPDFETALAAALSERIGRPVASTGLVHRLFSHFQHAHDMTALVRRARDRGIRTALLSNSWGNSYPDHIFDGMFDTVVISGEVGMRKPDADIFQYTSAQLGIPARASAFVDDLMVNVTASKRLGYLGVHHRTYGQTADQLSALFGVDLRE